MIANKFDCHPEDKAVSKVRNKPVRKPAKRPRFDAEAWFARLDELGGREFLPHGIPDDPPAQSDLRIFLDERSDEG